MSVKGCSLRILTEGKDLLENVGAFPYGLGPEQKEKRGRGEVVKRYHTLCLPEARGGMCSLLPSTAVLMDWTI